MLLPSLASLGDRGLSGRVLSQNQRTVEVRRDLWRSPCPTPSSSRDTYSRLPRSVFRRLLNISKDGDSATSLGNLCQCSVALIVKKCFLMFRWSLLCFSLCPLPLAQSLGMTEEPGSVFFPASLWILMRCPLRLLSST